MSNKIRERYLLDAYAILAYLGDEPGAADIETLILKAKDEDVELLASWVSICEVYYQAQRRSGLETAQAVVAAVKNWPIKIIPAGEKESIIAGDLKAKYKVSLGDSYALGTAEVHGAMIVTGDPEFKPLEKAERIKVFWLSREGLKRKA